MKGQSTRPGSLAARHSFVVRIWREEGRAGWRGWVQHTRSGESAAVQDLNGLLTFVEHRTGSLSRPGQKRLK
jgi:hypothetical protein